MSDATSTAPPKSEPDTGADESASALTRYRASMRRARIRYVAVVGVIVIALGVFVGVMWSRGEAAHSYLHTVSTQPAALPLATPSDTQTVAWRTSDRLAIGTLPAGGTVITYDKRTVRGRDARTGASTWTYSRTNRTVCTAAQLGGTTIAIYELNGNCDQVSAFDSESGARRWTRTLDIDGQPLFGRPTYQWTPSTLMITSPSVIYAIDPVSGLNRWTYSRVGCRIGTAVLGSAGALVSQTCTHPQCGNLKMCGAGVQLFLRDGTAGNGDDSKADRDQFKWNRMGNADVPVSAGVVVSALDPSTRGLSALQASNGSPSPVTLTPAPTSASGAQTSETQDAQLIWLDGVTYALPSGPTRQLWATPTVTAPTVTNRNDAATSLSTSRISAGVTGAIADLDGASGTVQQRFDVPPPGPTGRVSALGSGFVVSGPAGTVAYK
jgi:PQQ-like domain